LGSLGKYRGGGLNLSHSSFSPLRVRRWMAALLVALLLPWLVPEGGATAVPGAAVGLVAPEQRIRESSSAVPVLGFSFSASGTEALDNISVYFYGTFYAGDNRTLRTLNRDGALSGVALYRDNGAVDDALDPADTPVYLDDTFWSGNYARLVLSNNTEFIPGSVSGSLTWFIVIRSGASSSYLFDGYAFYARLYPGAVVATNGTGLVYLPAATLTTNALIVHHTRAVNMLTTGTSYIGPGTVPVHERAVLGLTVVDGSNASDTGIDDRIAGLELRISQVGGSIAATDFAPIGTDSRLSGISFYRDDGTLNDDWDPADTPIRLGSIAPDKFGGGSASGVTLAITFSPPLVVPGSENGLLDFFFVARTGAITTGDALRAAVILNSVRVDGLLSPDKGRTAMTGYNITSSTLYGDDTPPAVVDLWWGASSSAYVTTVGPRRLYFNHEMGAPVCVTAFATLTDAGAGLMNLTWPLSLSVPSPATADLSGNSFTTMAYFEVGAGTTGNGEAIDLIAFDRLGNRGSALEQLWNVTYTFDPRLFFMDPAPGWYNASGDGIHIDSSGTLWFSDHIQGTSTAWVGVNVTSLYGLSLIENVTASFEPQLAAPTNPDSPFRPANNTHFFSTQYGFWANSSQGRGAVAVAVHSSAGTLESLDFPIREDNNAPVVNIAGLSDGQVFSGAMRVSATAQDAGSGISRVWGEYRPDGGAFAMYADGQGGFFFDLLASSLADGPGHLVVFAEDHVGNVGSALVDLIVRSGRIDAEAPRVAVAAPKAGAVLSGPTVFEVAASDAGGLSTVWVRLDDGEWLEAALDADTGYFTLAWNTSASPDGAHTLRAAARDLWGNEATSAPILFTVDNGAPTTTLVAPLGGATVRGPLVIQVYARDAVAVEAVTLDLDGRAVPMAFNSASGYYEYVLDTRSLVEGEHRLTARAVDLTGKTVLTEDVAITVRNRDDWGPVFGASAFLLLLFAVAAFFATLLLVRNGALRRWLARAENGGPSVASREGPAPPAPPERAPAALPSAVAGATPSVAAVPPPPLTPSADRVPCPKCGAGVRTGWRFCPQCNQELVWE